MGHHLTVDDIDTVPFLNKRRQKRRDIWEFQKKCLRQWNEHKLYTKIRYNTIRKGIVLEDLYLEKVPVDEIYLIGYEAKFIPKSHLKDKWFYDDLVKVLELCSPRTRYDEYGIVKSNSYYRKESTTNEWSPTPINEEDKKWIEIVENNPLVKKWFSLQLIDRYYRTYWGYIFNRMNWVEKVKVPIYREYIYYFTDLMKEYESRDAYFDKVFCSGHKEILAVYKLRRWSSYHEHIDRKKHRSIQKSCDSFKAMMEEIYE
jgi:hypothetical protein